MVEVWSQTSMFPDQLICPFFDNLHLPFIKNNSPKRSLENSSAQWAVFYGNPITILVVSPPQRYIGLSTALLYYIDLVMSLYKHRERYVSLTSPITICTKLCRCNLLPLVVLVVSIYQHKCVQVWPPSPLHHSSGLILWRQMYISLLPSLSTTPF